jgi:hypothetical protein
VAFATLSRVRAGVRPLRVRCRVLQSSAFYRIFVVLAPSPKRKKYGTKALAERRDLILHSWWHLWIRMTHDDTIGLQFTQLKVNILCVALGIARDSSMNRFFPAKR